MLHSFSSYKCGYQFQLLRALELLLFLCRNLSNLLRKVGITVAKNHCPILSFDSKKTPACIYPFATRNFRCTSTRLPRENIWQKTRKSAKSCLKVSILYITQFNFLDQGRWWRSTLLPWQPAGIEVVSIHFNVLCTLWSIERNCAFPVRLPLWWISSLWLPS